MNSEEMFKSLQDAKYLDGLVSRTLRRRTSGISFYEAMAAQMIRLAAKRGIKLSEAKALEFLHQECRRQESAFERCNFR